MKIPRRVSFKRAFTLMELMVAMAITARFLCRAGKWMRRSRRSHDSALSSVTETTQLDEACDRSACTSFDTASRVGCHPPSQNVTRGCNMSSAGAGFPHAA